MGRLFFLTAALTFCSLNMEAQPPEDTSSKYPQGATYKHSSGTATITSDYSSSTQYYNVIQCTGGTLTMNGCTITKTGDGSGGDNSSFYGNNSSIYCGAASSTNYQSTTAANGAKIVINNVTVNGSAQGANAVIATNVEIDGITIVNDKSVSRGLHATYGGIITASNVDITTNEATSSTIATDRGGGTVTVNGGTATANGSKSAVIYSTGTMSATDLIGTSAKGEIAVIEGDNNISMTNCTMTSGSDERALLMMQSGSGDASGVNPVMTITGTSLTLTDGSAPLLQVSTCVTATCTFNNCTLCVPSGILMYVMDDDQWSTSGAIGNLVLSNGTYSGIVKYDTGYTANVTVNSGATWNLTANTSIGTLVNNGIINTNGYTLTTTSKSGSGTINESKVSIAIGSTGWSTLCSPVALDFSGVSGLTAYTAAFGESTITLTEVSQIPASTPVILKGTASTTYSIPTTTSASAVSGNDLLGTLTGSATDTDNYTYYALAKIDESTVGFAKVSTSGIPASKAYYRITASSSAPERYTFGDTETGISEALYLNNKAEMINNKWYDLQGRQMKSPAKGIYVKEGKKVLYK